jgi:hypothetical protein
VSRLSARILVPLAASSALLLAAHAAGLLVFLLPVVPLLVLVTSLLCGVYPGCETIVRLAERLASRQRLRAVARQPRLARTWSFAASGGLLIACARAKRPPPLPA